MRVGFFLKEASRSLRRSAAPSLAAVLTVLITAVVLGVFIPIVQATTGTANEVRGRVVVDVYLKAGATGAQRDALRRALVASPDVKAVDFVSKQEALAHMRGRNRDAFALLGTNPLPDSFRVPPRDPDRVKAIAATLRRPPRAAAIDEVRNRERD